MNDNSARSLLLISQFNFYKSSKTAYRPSTQPVHVFGLFAAVSFGIWEGNGRRSTRSPVLTSLMTALIACEHGMLRGCAISGEPPMLHNRMKEGKSCGQPMLDVRSCGPPVSQLWRHVLVASHCSSQLDDNRVTREIDTSGRWRQASTLLQLYSMRGLFQYCLLIAKTLDVLLKIRNIQVENKRSQYRFLWYTKEYRYCLVKLLAGCNIITFTSPVIMSKPSQVIVIRNSLNIENMHWVLRCMIRK